MQFEDIEFRLDSFEGPLDLLLHLIAKNKVSIYDIPIAMILDQYMEYINAWKSMNFDIAGEFIVTASELMLIKSKMLLPKPKDEEEEDPRLKLAQALVEYKQSKELASVLSERFKDYHGRLTKDPEVIEADIDYLSQDISLLALAFGRIVKRAKANSDSEQAEQTQTSATLGKIITTKTYSVPMKIISIMRYMYKRDKASMMDIFSFCRDRSELITEFVALLELIRAERISIITDSDGSVSQEPDDVYFTMDKVSHHSNSFDVQESY